MSRAATSVPSSPKSIKSPKGKLIGGIKSNEGGMPEEGALPPCPKDGDYSETGPCQNQKRRSKSSRKKSGGGKKQGRKTEFRVPLKKEDGNMEAQVVEYHCEFPNRVVVRMEYLMQSTKVRLNDKAYMDDFYYKLLAEEEKSLAKATRLREKAELNRMKKLIIDGVNMEVPAELSYLHRHPVFRVNRMLARLRQYEDNSLVKPQVDGDDEITPVEPYEFDGNTFFKRLHDEGIVWMPPFYEHYERERLDGKVYRAKLRLLMKRKEQAAEEKALRLVGDLPPSATPDYRQSTVQHLLQEEIKEQETEDKLLSKALHMETSSKALSAGTLAASRVRAKSRQEIVSLQEKVNRSKEIQAKRDRDMDLMRHVLDKNYLDTFDYEYQRIVQRYAERQKRRNAEEVLEQEIPQRRRSPVITTAPSKTIKPYKDIFKKPVDRLPLTGKPEEDLFPKLQMHYEVAANYPFQQYKEFDNTLIKNLDTLEEGEKMMDYAEEVVNMYAREEVVGTEHQQKMQPKEEDMQLDQEDSSISVCGRKKKPKSKKRKLLKSSGKKELSRKEKEKPRSKRDSDMDMDLEEEEEDDFDWEKPPKSGDSSRQQLKPRSRKDSETEVDLDEPSTSKGLSNKSLKEQGSKTKSKKDSDDSDTDLKQASNKSSQINNKDKGSTKDSRKNLGGPKSATEQDQDEEYGFEDYDYEEEEG